MMGMTTSHVSLRHSAGPLRSASADVRCRDWRVRVVGDVGGWGTHSGFKEARVTLTHNVDGQSSPFLQVRTPCTQIPTTQYIIVCASAQSYSLNVSQTLSLEIAGVDAPRRAPGGVQFTKSTAEARLSMSGGAVDYTGLLAVCFCCLLLSSVAVVVGRSLGKTD